MKEGYVIRNQTLPHFITATVVDWIDACLSADRFLHEKFIAKSLWNVWIIALKTKEWFCIVM